jgi:dihydrofolate reductase
MLRLRVHNLSISLDGYVAGPDQNADHPIGVGGTALHDWVFATRTGRAMIGETGGTEGLDDEFLRRGQTGIGATIMGRNMFGPVRGPWRPDGAVDAWTGWWGDDPPFHHPVFVLTQHPRRPVRMAGGTTFHFVTDGIESALQRAFDAADGQDVRLGGGAATVQQYLVAGLVDELHLAIVPVLLGAGERLFESSVQVPDGYRCTELVSSPAVAHLVLTRGGAVDGRTG